LTVAAARAASMFRFAQRLRESDRYILWLKGKLSTSFLGRLTFRR